MTKEVKKAKRPEEQVRVQETFAPTPPLECVQLLLSLFMTKRPGMKKRKLGVWDISRAHFMGRAEREIYIQLPVEDRMTMSTEVDAWDPGRQPHFPKGLLELAVRERS